MTLALKWRLFRYEIRGSSSRKIPMYMIEFVENTYVYDKVRRCTQFKNWNSREVKVKYSCPLMMTVTFALISRLFRFSVQSSLESWCKSERQLYWELEQLWYKSGKHLFSQMRMTVIFALVSRLFRFPYYCKCSRDVRVNDNFMENWNNYITTPMTIGLSIETIVIYECKTPVL